MRQINYFHLHIKLLVSRQYFLRKIILVIAFKTAIPCASKKIYMYYKQLLWNERFSLLFKKKMYSLKHAFILYGLLYKDPIKSAY